MNNYEPTEIEQTRWSRQVRALLVALTIAFTIIYVAGSGFWVSTGDAWYQKLAQPSWQPPDWVFGVIWPYNFIVLAIAGTLIALRLPRVYGITFLVFYFFSASFALLWSYVFYSRHDLSSAVLSLGLAAILTVPMWLLTFRISRVMGWLFAPYQLWIILATALSVGYALKN